MSIILNTLRETKVKVGFTGYARDCTGGVENHCDHPAPYEVRDSRHRIVGQLCVKHLEEYRQLAVGYGPSLRNGAA